ncbi:unnamed protein product [Phaeothamnion confervicola]
MAGRERVFFFYSSSPFPFLSETTQSVRRQSQRLLGIEQPEQKSSIAELEEAVCGFCPTLTYKERLIGFGICFGIGWIITIGSLFRILQLLAGNPVPFVVFYTIGNLLSICASLFLSGPWAQLKRMFAPSRFVATSVYLGAMALTFFVAFASFMPGREAILILLIIVQFAALCWYTMTYIPFARQYMTKCCGQLCADEV